MKKLKASWSPFPPEYSSCSSLKPKFFEWSKSEGIASVWIDNNILNHRGNKNGNFGWFCESSEILPDLKINLMSNYQVLRNHFQNIFTCDSEIISKDPSFFLFNPPGSNLPWTNPNNYRIHEKTKLCSMVCSSKDMTTGHKLRLGVALNVKDKIDLFGGAHGSSRSGNGIGPSGDWWRSRDESLAPYMFSFVFENASYNNYYTEKITDCFANGTIPVYWGDPKIGETFNMEGIILWKKDFDVSKLTQDLYHEKKEAISNNLDVVKRLESADDTLYNKILSLL
jgi:hypothetical protein